MQAAPRDVTVSSYGPEDRAFNNSGPVEPLSQRADRASVVACSEGQAHLASRAFLVCLRFADGDNDAVGGELEVTYIDTCKLRAAKSARESDEDKCGVPKAEDVFAPGGDDAADVGRK
jgi:hypothetical protein